MRHGIELSPEQAALLDRYCHRLWEWNEKLNLTRHTDYERFAARDLLDSVQLSRQLNPGEAVLDVGSGGGVPGLLLAILRPDVRVELCESVAKKARVLEQIVAELGLAVPVHAQRAEQLLAHRRFDTLVARAVGSLARMLTWFAPCWGSIGRLLVVKGPRWVEERKAARHLGLLRTLQLRRLAAYPMPGTDAESVILMIWPDSPREPEPRPTGPRPL